MKRSYFCQAVLAGIGILLGATAQAASVQVTASGDSYELNNTAVGADFWTVTISGDPTVSITSIQIDVGTVGTLADDVHFDFDADGTFACNPACFDGSFNLDPSQDGPVLNTTGGTVDPVFGPFGLESKTLSITSNTGFNIGDFFTFGANTNGTSGTGADAGFETGNQLAGAQLTAFFSDGSTGSVFFAADCGALCSSATINSAVIPVPAAVWLFGSGLLGLAGIARRKA